MPDSGCGARFQRARTTGTLETCPTAQTTMRKNRPNPLMGREEFVRRPFLKQPRWRWRSRIGHVRPSWPRIGTPRPAHPTLSSRGEGEEPGLREEALATGTASFVARNHAGTLRASGSLFWRLVLYPQRRRGRGHRSTNWDSAARPTAWARAR